MANNLTSPEELFNAKNVGFLLKRMDPDLAANVVFSAISLNSQKIIEVIQACIIVSSQRYADKNNPQQKAEEIVERVMSQFDPQADVESKAENK